MSCPGGPEKRWIPGCETLLSWCEDFFIKTELFFLSKIYPGNILFQMDCVRGAWSFTEGGGLSHGVKLFLSEKRGRAKSFCAIFQIVDWKEQIFPNAHMLKILIKSKGNWIKGLREASKCSKLE